MIAFEILWFTLTTWVSVISFTFPQPLANHLRPKHHRYHRFTILSTLQFDANIAGEDTIGFISTSYDADANVLFDVVEDEKVPLDCLVHKRGTEFFQWIRLVPS